MARDEAYREAEWRIEVAQQNETGLDLSDLGLTELPEAIGQLVDLQGLNLSSNPLTTFPEELGNLTQLRQLYAYKNQLMLLPECLGNLTQLRTLELSSHQLATLPEFLGNLTQLQTLYLNDNQLATLPESLGNLTRLQTLSLDNNQLATLPESLGNLTRLQTLSLDNNQLATLPESLGNLTRLQKLSLDNNPLNPELAAASKQGTEEVQKYLRAKAEGKIVLNEAKLILVGEGAVGKSCLLGALRGDPWIEDRPTTHGIEIKPVNVTNPDNNTEITLNAWDFGGQRVYRPTHQLFFSPAAIYLVIWKPREGPQQGFVTEWITLIKRREPDAKILVIATHGDPNQRQPDIDRQELIDRFGKDTVLGFCFIDSKPDRKTQCRGIQELRTQIATIAATLPGMGRTIPAKWYRVLEALRATNAPYLAYNDVLAICREQGVEGFLAELCLRVYHTLGNIIHYHYDPLLKDIVILKPDWLAKAIGFILDDETIRKNNGLIQHDYLSQIWENPPYKGETGYPRDLHPIFLRLMERFDVSYRVVFYAMLLLISSLESSTS